MGSATSLLMKMTGLMKELGAVGGMLDELDAVVGPPSHSQPPFVRKLEFVAAGMQALEAEIEEKKLATLEAAAAAAAPAEAATPAPAVIAHPSAMDVDHEASPETPMITGHAQESPAGSHVALKAGEAVSASASALTAYC